MFRTVPLSIIRSFSLYTANLYDIYHCCVCSEKLLMMDRRTKHTHTHTRYGCTGRLSPRRRGLYLSDTQYSYQRQTSMPTKGFEPAIPASERQQMYAFDRTAIGIGRNISDSSRYFVIYAVVACRNANTSLCEFCTKQGQIKGD